MTTEPRERSDPVEEAVSALRDQSKFLREKVGELERNQNELDERLAEPLARLTRIANRRRY